MGKTKTGWIQLNFLLWTTCDKFVLCHDLAEHLQQSNGSRACLLLHFAEQFVKTCVYLPSCLFEILPSLLDAAITVSVWVNQVVAGNVLEAWKLTSYTGDVMVVPGMVLPLPAISQPILGPCSGVSKKEGPVLTSNLDTTILFGRREEFSSWHSVSVS